MKKDYMTRLERAARWRLPRQEAEDVIADYRDIVGNPPRPEDELRRDVGDPEQVIKLLVSPPTAYRIWQAVFAIMVACILIPGVTILGPLVGIWDMCFAGPYTGYIGQEGHWGPVLAGAGLVVSLVWFRLWGQKETQKPRAIPILLTVLAVWCGVVLALDLWCMRDPLVFSEMWGRRPLYSFFGLISPLGPEGYTVSRSLQVLQTVLKYGGVIASLLGVFGLVCARTQDRRWAGVYVLAMAVMLVSMESLALWYSLDSSAGFEVGWYWPHLRYFIATTTIGLVGAGVALW